MEILWAVLAGLMAAVLGWAFINVLLRPRVRVSQNIVIGQAFGRGPRAQVKIVNRGIATLTNVVPEAWVAVREAGERQLLRLSATSPMLPHLGSRRPKRYRRDSVTALPQRILTLELPSDPDPRLVEWAGAEGGMTFEKGNQALAAALSRRVDYELILTIEATDSLTGVRALAALTSFSTTNVCRGKFARGTSVDVEPEINTEESPSVTEHDAPASTQIVNVAGILRDLNMEDALTTEEKAEIARRAADELTDRVGSRLAAGLTKTQMDEFEAFTDRRELEAFAWLQANEPGFREDGRFVQVRRALPEDSSDLDVVCEYASLAWLERNRPGHRQEVAVLAREVEAEVRAYLLRVREERMDPKSPSEGPTE